MVHEQTRNDRDEHVKYECRNVQGYTDALSKATAAENLPDAEAYRRLCEDRVFALKYWVHGEPIYEESAGEDAR